MRVEGWGCALLVSLAGCPPSSAEPGQTQAGLLEAGASGDAPMGASADASMMDAASPDAGVDAGGQADSAADVAFNADAGPPPCDNGNATPPPCAGLQNAGCVSTPAGQAVCQSLSVDLKGPIATDAITCLQGLQTCDKISDCIEFSVEFACQDRVRGRNLHDHREGVREPHRRRLRRLPLGSDDGGAPGDGLVHDPSRLLDDVAELPLFALRTSLFWPRRRARP